MVVSIKDLPTYEDTYAKDDFVRVFQNVFNENTTISYADILPALTIPLEDQHWYSLILYDLDLIDVFEIYNVARDNLDAIKALSSYNFNPSLNNLYNFLDTVLPSTTTFLVENDINGVVNIDFFNLEALQGDISISDTTDVILIDETVDNLLYINPAIGVLYDQTLYLLINYVASGVKLTVNVVTSFDVMLKKYQESMSKEDFKTKVNWINTIIKKGVE